MTYTDLPQEFNELLPAVIDTIRRAYDVNSDRHDPLIGDDLVVFGIAIYRNSWFLIEQEVEAMDHWRSARPQGSLLLTGAGRRVHVYRHGNDAEVDLDSFRMDDERSSVTQRMIAASNSEQLSLALEWAVEEEAAPVESDLTELVIIHAGNPEDGCCGIWIGAPIAAEEITTSPWHWTKAIWLASEDQAQSQASSIESNSSPSHDELPEPEIDLRPVDGEEEGDADSEGQ